MKLKFLGSTSETGDCPTLYETHFAIPIGEFSRQVASGV